MAAPARPQTKAKKAAQDKRPALFSVPEVRKALKVATDMGLPLAGYEITASGGIRVLFATKEATDADASLTAWLRSSSNG